VRILVVSQYFRPESFRVNDLAAVLVERGHAVTVLTGLPNYPGGKLYPGYSWRGPYRESFAGYEVRRVPLLPRGDGGGLRLALNYLSFAVMGCLLGPWLLRGRFDVVFVHAPSPITACLPALWLKLWRRLPVVLWVQDLWPESLAAAGAVRSSLLLGAVGRLVRAIYRRCDLVLGQSEAFVGAIRARSAESRVAALPNWAEDFYRPLALDADAPERAEMPAGFTLLFAGNLGAAQSLETILAAAQRLRDEPVHWAFLGDGRRREWLEAEVRARGLQDRVRLLGWRPAERVPRYLALAGGLLVTLRREPIFEATVPTKVQSSLAAGRPVLAALDGEPARILAESGGALVVPAEDGEGLAAAALRLLRMDAGERDAMGARCRGYAERHFDRELLVTRLEDWMRELVEEAA